MKQFALIIISVHLLFSCSLNYHLNKAIKKGYRCEVGSDTIRISSVDSFPVIVHDSIVWEKVLTQKDTVILHKTSYVPKTRFEIRFDNKRFNDSLKYIRKVYSDSLKAEIKMHNDSLKADVKIEKQDTRQSKKPNLWLLLIGFVMGFFTHLLFKFSKLNL